MSFEITSTSLFLFPPVLNRAHLPRLSPGEEEVIFSTSAADQPVFQAARYHARYCAATTAAVSRIQKELAVRPLVVPFLFVKRVTKKKVEELARILAERMREFTA